jgi:hypothetical protein
MAPLTISGSSTRTASLTESAGAVNAGMQLVLPCEDGRLTPDAALGTVTETQETKSAAVAETGDTYERPIRILSANGWAALPMKA